MAMMSFSDDVVTLGNFADMEFLSDINAENADLAFNLFEGRGELVDILDSYLDEEDPAATDAASKAPDMASDPQEMEPELASAADPFNYHSAIQEEEVKPQ